MKLSPNGKYITYSNTTSYWWLNFHSAELILLNTDSMNKITLDTENPSDIVWSPNSTKLVYTHASDSCELRVSDILVFRKAFLFADTETTGWTIEGLFPRSGRNYGFLTRPIFRIRLEFPIIFQKYLILQPVILLLLQRASMGKTIYQFTTTDKSSNLQN
jgi:hypothetical protein